MADPQDGPHETPGPAPEPPLSAPRSPGPHEEAAPPEPKPPAPGPPTATTPAPAKKAPGKKAAKKSPAKKAAPNKQPAKKVAAKKAPAKKAAAKKVAPAKPETNGQLAAAAKDAAAHAKSTVDAARNPLPAQHVPASPNRSPVPFAVAIAISVLAVLLVRRLRQQDE